MKLKSLIFALFLANPLAWSKCPEVWVGSYAWEETWEHPSGEEITNGHYAPLYQKTLIVEKEVAQ